MLFISVAGFSQNKEEFKFKTISNSDIKINRDKSIKITDNKNIYSSNSNSRVVVENDSFPTYDDVVICKNIELKAINKHINEWIAETYEDPKSVIKYISPDGSKIIIRAQKSFIYYYRENNDAICKYTITFNLKNGKYKWTVDINDVLDDSGNSMYPLFNGSYNATDVLRDIQSSVSNKLELIIFELRSQLSTIMVNEKKNNW